MHRQVPVPLARQPEVLWGLTAGDLIWPAAAAVADLALWHWIRPYGEVFRWTAVAVVAACGAYPAWGRIDGQRPPAFVWRWIRYRLGANRYLPPQ